MTPNTHRALIQHAQILVAEREYAKALPLLRRAQKIEPRDTVSRYLEQVAQIVKTLRPTPNGAALQLRDAFLCLQP
ncbi:MAG TPA: hypothetical protein PKI20_08020 [Verrucomicrobiota bacterium]|jgi:hypothetical protein|nr:hypothetical protein [Verrucomicrobiota bacterium]HQL77519.1 hypothetical protein [Verrucomicrobiota bacterium]